MGQRGIALIAVLWTTMLLAALAASFSATTRTELQLARNALESAKAEALADAGVYRAILALLNDEQEKWRQDGTPYVLEFSSGKVEVSIQDEGGKIDLNTGHSELLQGLFRAVGVAETQAEALSAAIAAFRNSDHDRKHNAAEDEDYRTAGAAEVGNYVMVNELRLVMGMTPHLYRRIAPFLTVYSWQRGIDPLTAPREVLLALPGIKPDEVELVLGQRIGPAKEDSSGSGGSAKRGNSPVASRTASAGADARAEAIWSMMAEYAPFLSEWRGVIFSVRAEAKTNGGAVFTREAVLSLKGRPGHPYLINAWKRGDY